MDKIKSLNWLIDNAEKIKIKEVYPDGGDGTPTLLIEFDEWETVDASPFEAGDACIVFE